MTEDLLIRVLTDWASNPLSVIVTLVVLFWLNYAYRLRKYIAKREALDRYARMQVEALQELEVEKRKNDAPTKAKIGDDGELVFESRHLPYAGDDNVGMAYVFTDEGE